MGTGQPSGDIDHDSGRPATSRRKDAPPLWSGVAQKALPPLATARVLGKRGHQRQSQTVGSLKLGRHIFVDGVLEVVAALALEVDPRVAWFKPQPITIRLDLERSFSTRQEAAAAYPRASSYEAKEAAKAKGLTELIFTPDFEAEIFHREVSTLIEVKDDESLSRMSEIMKRRRLVAQRLGYQFLVVPGCDLSHNGLANNLRLIRDTNKYLKFVSAVEHVAALEIAQAKLPPTFTIGQLRDLVDDMSINVGVALGFIAYDLHSGPLGRQSGAWFARGDLSHQQLLSFA